MGNHAVILCVTRKAQARRSSAAAHPAVGLGYVDDITRDYKGQAHHGVCALMSPSGQVYNKFLAFLKRIDAAVIAGLTSTLSLDNYATHKRSSPGSQGFLSFLTRSALVPPS